MTINTPLVSVILPAKNAAQYIERAVKSVLEQTYKNIELIIINDGSTDQTKWILEGLSDARIKIIEHAEAVGISTSLNEGIQASSGTLIARMDADDVSLPTRIESQVRFLNEHPEIGVCGTYAKTFGAKSLTIKHPKNPDVLAANLLFRTSLVHPTAMIRKQVLIEKKLSYDPTFTNAQDYDLWTRASIAGVALANIPKTLLLYRVTIDESRKEKKERQTQLSQKAAESLLRHLGIDLTEENRLIHKHIRSFSIPQDMTANTFIRQINGWFETILKANMKTKIYVSRALHHVLAHEWLNAALAIQNTGVHISVRDLVKGTWAHRTFIHAPLRTISLWIKNTLPA